MNRLCIVVILFCLQHVYCQLPEKDGDIIVEVSCHALIAGNDAEINVSSTTFYFTKRGSLLKKMHYTKTSHSQPQQDYEEAYSYSNNGKVLKMVKSIADNRNKLKALYETKYIYNKQGQLIDASVYNAGKRPVFMKVMHEYDSVGNAVKTIYGTDHYLEKEYEKGNKIIAIREIHADTLKWECNYAYKDGARTSTFFSRYNEGADVITEAIINNGKTVNRYTSTGSTDTKTKYYYDETGLLEKTEDYIYTASGGYILQSYTTVKVTGNLEKEIVDKINEQIIE